MSVHENIERKLTEAFAPSYLRVENESHMHAGPGIDSHFKAIVVSEAFHGERLLSRHRKVYSVLENELSEQVHALALHTYTEAEWATEQTAPVSPACMGGSKV